MQAFLNLVDNVIQLYIWAIIIMVVLQLLISFDVLNRSNRLVFLATDFLVRVTEPLLRAIRRIIPPFGTVDVSPLILILLLYFLRDLLFEYA